MKKSIYFAAALIALASCTSDEFTGEKALGDANGKAFISFSSGVNGTTRADKTGSEAAADLNGKFYVYGIKKESVDGAGNVQAGNLVYNNYVVEWADNSAYTTTSNTKGWEYVGKSLSSDEVTNITANSGTAVQTIKYWDWGAPDYTFYAFTALPADISGGKVSVVKNQTETTSVYDNGYTVTLAAGANLDKLYFAERVNITKENNTDRTQANKYGGNVTFRFHNSATKVRVAMYETIPGYTVTINKFSVKNDGADPAFADMTDDVTANFAANLQNASKGLPGTMTVTYDPTTGATQNYPVVEFTPTGGKNKVLALGTNLKASTVLGENITNAVYDKDGKSYTSVFPQENNTQNLKLKISYTLTAANTGETITVTDATAEIPAKYLCWKPGFAYTYIFKVSDNTNGSTGTAGTDPAGLYPITFDATEVITSDGLAEYITTVSAPSITTFGVDSSTGNYVTGGSEYAAGSDIYATIVEGTSVVTPVEGDGDGKVNYYSIAYKAGATDAEKAAHPITEASVAEAIAEAANVPAGGTPMIVCTKNNDLGAPVTTVPTEDGLTVNQNAVKFEALPAGTYAIEYTATAAWTGSYKKVYKVIVVQ